MRDKLIQQLKALLEYFTKTRRAGHTKAMLNGARDSDNAVLVLTLAA